MNEELSTCVSNLAYGPVGSWLPFYPRYPWHVRKLRQPVRCRPVMSGDPTRNISIGQCLVTPKPRKSLRGTSHLPRTLRLYMPTAPSGRSTNAAITPGHYAPQSSRVGIESILVSLSLLGGGIPYVMVFLKACGLYRSDAGLTLPARRWGGRLDRNEDSLGSDLRRLDCCACDDVGRD